MNKQLQPADILFNAVDVFGRDVCTTKHYWNKIVERKHRELQFNHFDVIKTLQNPDEVYRSVKDDYIRLFYKQFATHVLVVVVKYLNGRGFIITTYQTSKFKRKGEKLWQR